MANLEGENYNTFAERSFGGKVDGIDISGTVDFLVARGKYEPRTPYFFIQEYKKFKQGQDSDLLAQLLGEMLVCQVINSKDLICGAYIVGQYWRFVVLEKREYFVLDALNSTNFEELTEIISKLNWIKEYVEKQLKNNL